MYLVELYVINCAYVTHSFHFEWVKPLTLLENSLLSFVFMWDDSDVKIKNTVVRGYLGSGIGRILAQSVCTSDWARSAEQFTAHWTDISNVRGVKHLGFHLADSEVKTEVDTYLKCIQMIGVFMGRFRIPSCSGGGPAKWMATLKFSSIFSLWAMQWRARWPA